MKSTEQLVRDRINARIPPGGAVIEVMETPCLIAAVSWSKRDHWKCLAKLHFGLPYESKDYEWYTVSTAQMVDLRAGLPL